MPTSKLKVNTILKGYNNTSENAVLNYALLIGMQSSAIAYENRAQLHSIDTAI